MRVTVPLWKQHIQRMFKRHWLIQGKRKILETGSEKHIQKLGFPVFDANEYANRKPEYEKINIQVIGPGELVKPLDENHPEFKKKVCHLLNENNVLVEGFKQAQNLTKTVHVSETLPDSILSLVADVSDEMHESVKNIIMTGNIFDCEQKKLPKKHDPERPAYNFPRILGITDIRKNFIMSNMLLNLIERNSDRLCEDRLLTDSVTSASSFYKNTDSIRIQTVSNVLMSAKKPLKNISPNSNMADGIDVPDIHPVKYTASIPCKHFYDTENIYPIDKSVKAFHPHTTYLSYNSTQVKNLYDLPVTEDQMKSRSLIHAFGVCLAYIKELHGDVKTLPEPVTLQCIQSDGKNYYFGVLQMNTLDVDGTEGVKNMWYSMPMMQMYESCTYVTAKPTLESYNPEVIKYLKAFYHSQ